jgi:tetratricopeptide (TPR) repeat protein
MKKNRIRGFLSQLLLFFRRNNGKNSQKMRSLLERTIEEPMNAHVHLKLAEIYQKNGEKQKALSQYSKAAEIFCEAGQYPKGLAICKMLLKENPQEEHIKLELAQIYRKMGFLAEAFNQYHNLYCSYILAGAEDKALEMIGSMAELDPHKFTLDEKKNLGPQGPEKANGQKTNEKIAEIAPNDPPEKDKDSFFDLATMLEPHDPFESDKFKSVTMEEGHDFERIYEELKRARGVDKLYYNYNYQMGLVCRKMGLIDEAIKQFKVALEKQQNPIEASKLLSQCLKDKQCREEARNSSATALKEKATAKHASITDEIIPFQPLNHQSDLFDKSNP